MEWEDEKVIKLIELYRSKQLLWDPKHCDYKLRPKRFDAFNDIATELSTSVTEVERKIKKLTSHYNREKKKCDSSNKSGAGTEEIYESKWFAYKPLHFLRNKNVPTRTIDTDKPAEHHSQQDSHSQATENNLSQSTEKTLSELPRPNKRPRINLKDEMVSEALTIMKNVSERQNASRILEKDEDGLFGDYIAGQLRKMERSTKAIVRHRINNIIFEAETGSRADMFSDFSRPSSTHSHPGYYSAAPTNYSTSVYSAQSHETVSPSETFEEEISPLTRNSTQDIENILTSLNP